MPRWLIYIALIFVAVSWIPFALIARARSTPQRTARMQIIPDMDQQAKFRPQSVNPMFADARADRRPVEGTVAQGQLNDDLHVSRGLVDGAWAVAFPMPVTEAMMKRGQERYDIFCAPCHGLSGAGNGIVAVRADRLQEGTWTPPTNLHDVTVRERPVGHLYNTIANGIRNMPAYGAQIPVADRWAIVAYVRALQKSQNARVDDVPADLRPTLR